MVNAWLGAVFHEYGNDGAEKTLVVDSLHPECGQVVKAERIYFVSKPDERAFLILASKTWPAAKYGPSPRSGAESFGGYRCPPTNVGSSIRRRTKWAATWETE